MIRISILLLSAVTLLTAQPLPKFDVASVKPNRSDDPPSSNFPMGPGDVYTSNGGHFTAKNWPLITYISFAFKLMGGQAQSLQSQLPGWVLSEKFDIVARTDGDPAKDTKDQMRLMMRSLLADRFEMVARYETRQVPVFGLTLLKPGKFGPGFEPHPGDSACSTAIPTANNPGAAATVAGGFPTLCGGFLGMPPSAPGHQRVGARNITMPFIANGLTAMGNLGRPVLDQTGLTGTFDMVVEWVPESNTPPPPGADSQPDTSGPSFMEALKEQLGLKLESQKGPSDFLVIDHIEHPSEN